ncbi:MAG: response regulator [Acetatifactor sp.]|nr:response regulator [Acetatifactor sp.]
MKTWMRRCFIIMLFLSLAYFAWGQLYLPSESRIDLRNTCELFLDGWMQELSDGTLVPAHIPGDIKYEDNSDRIVIINHVPTDCINGEGITVKSYLQNMDFYLNGELISTYRPDASRIREKVPPMYWVFAPLAGAKAGDEIRVELSSSYPDAMRKVREIYFGNEIGFWIYQWNVNKLEASTTFVMLILSLLILILTFIVYLNHRNFLRMGYLGIGVLVTSVWMFCNSPLRQLFMHNVTVASDLAFLCVMLIPIPFSFYFNLLQGRRYEKAYSVLIIFSILDFIIENILVFSRVCDFRDNALIINGFLILWVLILVGTIFIDIFTRRIRDYFVTGVIMVIAGALGGLQSLDYIYNAADFNISATSFILMTLMIVAGLDGYHEVIKVNNERQSAIIASKMKSEFLANMSHEIRTPINAVLGMNEMILRDSKEDKILSYSRDIKASGNMLLSLINDILDFSKIESGKLDLVPVEYDLKRLVKELVVIVRNRVEEKGLDLSVRVDPATPRNLLGDENRVKQIALNLLSNAVKYTDAGEIGLKVGFETTDGNDIFLVISVRDTGKGIRHDDMDKLFDSFSRVDQKKNRNIEGTGLGLSITKRLIERMDGDIQVESEYGKGSKFVVKVRQGVISNVPVGKFNLDSEYDEHAEEKTLDFVAPGARILVVDDVPMNLKVFKGFLKDTFMMVDEALNAREAINFWREHKYDIVFLDHMMPDIDGIECNKLMHTPENVGLNADTPVIMLTANAMAGLKEQYLSSGFADYLSKPFKPQSLQSLVIKYLNSGKVRTVGDNRKYHFPIDHVSGLYNYVGDESFYEKMLKDFVENDRRDNLKSALKVKDYDVFRKTVHELKKNSEAIGAVEFRDLSILMEDAVKNGNFDYIEYAFDEYILKYSELLEFADEKH